MLIHLVLPMFSALLSCFYFRHFTLPLRKTNPNKLKASCNTSDQPCAIFCCWLQKTGTNVYPLTKVLLAQKEKMADNSEEKMANNSERDTDISFGGSWFVMSMLIRKWIEKWRSYRYRFVPWIALNLRKRCDFTWLNINIIITVTWPQSLSPIRYATLSLPRPA